MRIVNLTRFKELLAYPLPPLAQRAAGMISSDERRFLFGYAAGQYSGDGAIVDAGAFLGASTLALGTGLKANPRFADILERRPRPIVSYEQAITRPGMSKTFDRYGIKDQPPLGSSFEPILRQRIEQIMDLVDLNVGDLRKIQWNGEPIEFLFLDLIKNEEINRHVFKMFFPALRIGSIVVQQDYFIDALPHIKITQEALSPYFDFVGQLRPAAIFVVKESIPPQALDAALQVPLDRQIELLDAARRRTPDFDRDLLIQFSTILVLAHAKERERARALLDDLSAKIPEHGHWRLRDACDRARSALNMPRFRVRGGWRPETMRVIQSKCR